MRSLATKGAQLRPVRRSVNVGTDLAPVQCLSHETCSVGWAERFGAYSDTEVPGIPIARILTPGPACVERAVPNHLPGDVEEGPNEEAGPGGHSDNGCGAATSALLNTHSLGLIVTVVGQEAGARTPRPSHALEESAPHTSSGCLNPHLRDGRPGGPSASPDTRDGELARHRGHKACVGLGRARPEPVVEVRCDEIEVPAPAQPGESPEQRRRVRSTGKGDDESTVCGQRRDVGEEPIERLRDVAGGHV